MNKTRGLLLTAGFVLATAFTFSCSGDGGGGGEPSGGGNACTNLEPVTIGSQKWAKKNLDCEVGESKCYDNDPANCTKYGRLYDWETAKTACPSGWRLPTKDEWDILVNHAGGSSVAGAKLKAVSGWNENGNGTDEHGFTALPGGSYNNSDGYFGDVGKSGRWWSASELNSDSTYYRNMNYNGENVRRWAIDKSVSLSVRCLKNN